MPDIAEETILTFLTELSLRYHHPAELFLLGGSALCLLGSPRPTLDIDYVGDDLSKTELQRTIDQVASELKLEVEAVPIAGFVPLPDDHVERSVPIGQFGTIDVFVLDPYTIALSKIDRGFDTDIGDVVFLVQGGFVQLDRLDSLVRSALERSSEFALDPTEMRNHLQAVRDQI